MTNIFVSLGWNCYPGWTLRRIFSQPSCPYDWMQIPYCSSLIQILSPKGLLDCIDNFSVSILPPDRKKEHNPAFINQELFVRSPHDHDSVDAQFFSLEQSKQRIKEKLSRRWERLHDLGQNKRLCLLRTFCNGFYGLPPDSSDKLHSNMLGVMEQIRRTLNPIDCFSLVSIRTEKGSNASKLTINNVETKGRDRYIDVTTGLSFEDCFYMHTGMFTKEEAMLCWKEALSDESFNAICFE